MSTTTHPINYSKNYGSINISGYAKVQLGDTHTYNIGELIQQEYERFVESIAFAELHQREENIDQAHHGTFKWVFGEKGSRAPDVTRFRGWLQKSSANGSFWIRGKAGSGKSTFMTWIANHRQCKRHLRQWAATRNVRTLKHFFWELGTPLQRSTVGALRSLVWRIFNADPDRGFDIWKRTLRGEDSKPWTASRLRDALEMLLKDTNVFYCIFLDGLDECSDQDQMLKLLRKLETKSNVKICFSSRPERKLELACSHKRSLNLDSLTQSDMRKYAMDELQTCLTSPGSIKTENLRALVHGLLSKAQGVWVWLRVVVNSLVAGIENLDDMRVLLARLEDTPSDIHALYLQMLKRSSANLKHYAASGAHLFRLILDRQRPMTLERLGWALNAPLRRDYLQSELTPCADKQIASKLDLAALHVRVKTHSAYLLDVQAVQHSAFGVCKEPQSEYCFSADVGESLPATGQQCDNDQDELNGWSRDPTPIGAPDGSSVVAFFHNTIGHFLENTPEGQSIMERCEASDDDIAKSLRESDLVQLLRSEIRHPSQGLHELDQHLASHASPEVMHDFYEHWKLVDGCVARLLQNNQSASPFAAYIWFGAVPARLMNCEEAFLIWCICTGGKTEYMRKALMDPTRSFTPTMLTRMLWLTVKHWFRQAASDDPEESQLRGDIITLLKAGADPDMPFNQVDENDRFPDRWEHGYNLVQFCLHEIADNELPRTLYHKLLEVILLLQSYGTVLDLSQPINLDSILRKTSDWDFLPAGQLLLLNPAAKLGFHQQHCFPRENCAVHAINSSINALDEGVQPVALALCTKPSGWWLIAAESWDMIQRTAVDQSESIDSFMTSEPFICNVHLPRKEWRLVAVCSFFDDLRALSTQRAACIRTAMQNLLHQCQTLECAPYRYSIT